MNFLRPDSDEIKRLKEYKANLESRLGKRPKDDWWIKHCILSSIDELNNIQNGKENKGFKEAKR